MPIEYVYTEPEEVLCLKIKVPVVLAEEEVQVLVDSTVTLPELAKKVDHIDARVEDLEAEPVFIHESISNWFPRINNEWKNHFKDIVGRVAVVKKVIVSGVLHKQIFYVNNRDEVKHFAENVPFTKMVDLKEPQAVLREDDVMVQFPKPKFDITWELVRASRLHQTGVIIVRIKVVEERQIFVQLCPTPELCPPGNLLEDPGFEQWAGNVPIFWGATANVASTSIVHSGTLAAELGAANPASTAVIFQTVRRGIAPARAYRLTFWARENVAPVTPVSAFNLVAEVRFFDRNGMQIDGAIQSIGSVNIPDNNYQQFTLNVPVSPAGARTALIRFTFNPATGNTNTVKIDDASFECIGGFPA
ncbi:hypothetical protein J2Z49_000368 [Desulfofundulus luciae]|uniref:SipL SPOCS domain-containing protein n=1 Tax=Desulfofundulus luciae TaxID=74702 RepID=A0ABU0AXR0_9FIRM|nr:SPOCS domain-containing protein [Desulfofundulus luciae]MDQ0285275.1 hypothetical protein [Desulfofundulus luciae]